MVIEEILKIIIGCIILVLSSNFLIKSLVKLSRFIKISEFAISFLLLTFATSLPELLVGVTSALKGASSLSYSVVVGSNIINLSFILGITIIFAKRISVKGILRKSDSIHMTVIAILLLLLSGDGSVSRMDGLILLLTYITYAIDLFRRKIYFKNKNIRIHPKHAIISFIIFITSVAFLLISANMLVNSSLALVTVLDIPIVFIGFVIVAAGTSLPELVFEIEAIVKKKNQLAMGNVMGSIVANSALIVGISALISPIIFDDMSIIRISFLYFLLILLLLNVFMYTRKELDRWEGVVLVVIYLTYLAAEYHL